MKKYFNLPFYTLGGVRFWQDLILKNGWKLQQNLISKKCRLIDKYNIRRARGDFEFCKKELLQYLEIWEEKEKRSEITFILRGSFNSPLSFRKMAKFLNEKGFNAEVWRYSSFMKDVHKNARTLSKILDNLPEEIIKINFITFGVGGLVIRDLLSIPSEWHKRISVSKIVQIAPPNQGLYITNNLFARIFLYSLLGKSLKNLTNKGIAKIPPFPKDVNLAIIAGYKGSDRGYNLLSHCDNDGLICLSETKLPEAKDFAVFKIFHLFLPTSKRVINSVACFLTNGYLLRKTKKTKIRPVFKDFL